MADFTQTQIGNALANLGHYRVVKTQEVAASGPSDGIYGIHILSLGLRETGLRNINGGGHFVDGRWVTTKSDRGCFQISDKYHQSFLKSVAGCKEGSWLPTDGKTALDVGYCPQFTTAVRYANQMLQYNSEFAYDLGIKDQKDRVRFAIAAYNAGVGGARSGWKAGNVDKYTTGGDYSAWVIRHMYGVKKWLDAHPNWRP